MLWRGVLRVFLADSLLQALSNGACCQPLAKSSGEIRDVLALPRQQEVCSAGEEGSTIRTFIAQLIKLPGSCGQKAVLAMFLLDATLGMCSPKTPTDLCTL